MSDSVGSCPIWPDWGSWTRWHCWRDLCHGAFSTVLLREKTCQPCLRRLIQGVTRVPCRLECQHSSDVAARIVFICILRGRNPQFCTYYRGEGCFMTWCLDGLSSVYGVPMVFQYFTASPWIISRRYLNVFSGASGLELMACLSVPPLQYSITMASYSTV